MRIAIVGSRDFLRLDVVQRYVSELPPDVVVVSGGARGVDRAAEETAKYCGLRVWSIRPDYNAHGKSAPILRNTLIARECDRMVAFWDGESMGTIDAVRKARKLCKPVQLFRCREFLGELMIDMENVP